MNNAPTCPDTPTPAPAATTDPLLEQQIQHMLVAVEHELRMSLSGTDELNLIKTLQKSPWRLIGDLDFHDTGQLYPVHFLLFHVLYRLRDSLAKNGEKLHISPLRIVIEHQDLVDGNGLPGTMDSLRHFYLDLSQYRMPKEALEQMMNNFWVGHRNAGPDKQEVLLAAKTLGFDSVPDCFLVVKHAFRRAVMQAHPDRGGDTEAIQSLNEAFSVMKAHFSQMMEQS